ncbi:MAG TPA: calcium-binding protein [Marmoricola sp.]|nr:calcium-binding protein [Marmoricola sp.]
MAAGTGAGMVAANAAPPANVGPPYPFTEAIFTDDVVPLKNGAMITESEHGYIYHAGQQDGHLTVTMAGGALRFHDTATARWEKLVAGCHEVNVNKGVAAVCSVPGYVSASRPLLLEVWPRLGDDFTSGRTLPASIAMAVLGDAGDDVAKLGAGPDFFNGAFGRDRVVGGPGNDWLRTGEDDDVIRGGTGNDYLMGVAGADVILGAGGNDRIGGDQGDDRLFAGSGADVLGCGTGSDDAKIDSSDSARDCEAVVRK